MSYAGHVLDMIRRSKENREALKHRSNQMAANKRKAQTKKTLSPNTNISPKELERIKQNMEKRESDEQRHLLFVQILIGGIIILLLAILVISRLLGVSLLF